jgi:hypothetical protein
MADRADMNGLMDKQAIERLRRDLRDIAAPQPSIAGSQGSAWDRSMDGFTASEVKLSSILGSAESEAPFIRWQRYLRHAAHAAAKASVATDGFLRLSWEGMAIEWTELAVQASYEAIEASLDGNAETLPPKRS